MGRRLPEGRAFGGQHGDGTLTEWGEADVAGWPAADAVGAGFRGAGFSLLTLACAASGRVV